MRRRGIGSRLLSQFEDQARRVGVLYILTNIATDDDPADYEETERFITKRGFIKDSDSVVYRKIL